MPGTLQGKECATESKTVFGMGPAVKDSKSRQRAVMDSIPFAVQVVCGKSSYSPSSNKEYTVLSYSVIFLPLIRERLICQ